VAYKIHGQMPIPCVAPGALAPYATWVVQGSRLRQGPQEAWPLCQRSPKSANLAQSADAEQGPLALAPKKAKGTPEGALQKSNDWSERRMMIRSPLEDLVMKAHEPCPFDR
jgi:hypothetical protein